MKKTFFAVTMVGATLLFSCSDTNHTNPELVTTTVETSTVETKSGVNWEYDHSTTEVQWTGYKLEAKAGVQGWFDSIVVSGFTPGPDASKAMEGVTFEIYTESIASGDTTRDGKLAKFLFGEMETPVITGEIKSVSDGQAIVDVTMAGMTLPLEMSCEVMTDGNLKMLGTIASLKDFGPLAVAGFEAISEACSEKHEGVTHEDVEIKVYTTLKKAE